MKKIIPYGRQFISNDDIKSVVKVLKSEYLTTGPLVKKFENKISKFVKSKYCLTFNSATSALHVACKAAGLGPGDILWTSPNSFVASANCALYCGAKVDFVDIELKNYNIDINLLEKKLANAKKNNNLPKIIIPILYAGHPHEMYKLKKLSNLYKFKIIEDASHALGAKYKGEYVGNCKYSDISIFSTHPVKMITTGEGGIATTNNKNYLIKMDMLRSHGITRNKNFFKIKKRSITHYEQQLLGYNYRLNDLQSALGISQLKKLNFFIKERVKIKNFYEKNLKKFPLILPKEKKNYNSSWHLYPVLLDKKKTKKKKNEFLKYLRDNNILVNSHYIPIHTHPYYKNMGFKYNDFKNSLFFYNYEISLPIYVGLSKLELNYIIKKIGDFINK